LLGTALTLSRELPAGDLETIRYACAALEAPHIEKVEDNHLALFRYEWKLTIPARNVV
jgi:hypothetical protein